MKSTMVGNIDSFRALADGALLLPTDVDRDQRPIGLGELGANPQARDGLEQHVGQRRHRDRRADRSAAGPSRGSSRSHGSIAA